jgi:hypothetical protein
MTCRPFHHLHRRLPHYSPSTYTVHLNPNDNADDLCKDFITNEDFKASPSGYELPEDIIESEGRSRQYDENAVYFCAINQTTGRFSDCATFLIISVLSESPCIRKQS